MNQGLGNGGAEYNDLRLETSYERLENERNEKNCDVKRDAQYETRDWILETADEIGDWRLQVEN